MKITVEQFQLMKKAPNSAYNDIMPEFLFHSNKLEGSTFSEEELVRLVEEGVVSGDHDFDDVLETRNSIDVFGHVIDTLGKPVTKECLCELNAMLFKGTSAEQGGFTGHYKTIPNRIRNSSGAACASRRSGRSHGVTRFALGTKATDDLPAAAAFHARFEHIHPFQDGNGRIGRFLMLKQSIECANFDLAVVDEEFEQPYKAVARSTRNPKATSVTSLKRSKAARSASTRKCAPAASTACCLEANETAHDPVKSKEGAPLPAGRPPVSAAARLEPGHSLRGGTAGASHPRVPRRGAAGRDRLPGKSAQPRRGAAGAASRGPPLRAHQLGGLRGGGAGVGRVGVGAHLVGEGLGHRAPRPP